MWTPFINTARNKLLTVFNYWGRRHPHPRHNTTRWLNLFRCRSVTSPQAKSRPTTERRRTVKRHFQPYACNARFYASNAMSKPIEHSNLRQDISSDKFQPCHWPLLAYTAFFASLALCSLHILASCKTWCCVHCIACMRLETALQCQQARQHRQLHSKAVVWHDTINHVVASCPLTKLAGNCLLHSADDNAVTRLKERWWKRSWNEYTFTAAILNSLQKPTVILCLL